MALNLTFMGNLDKKVIMLLVLSITGIIFSNQLATAAQPILAYNPPSYDFGDKEEGISDSTTFEIWNGGCSCAKLIYILNESCSWVNVTPTSGSSHHEHDTITVSINTTGLSAGLHICNISIESNAGKRTFTVRVKVVIPPLIAYANAPNNSTTASPVQFFGSASGGVPPYTWFWNFGDGNISYEQNPIHQYADDGVYNVTLAVTDDNGATNTTYKLITILNTPPIADFTYTPSYPTNFDMINFTDKSYDLDGSIVNYTWNFEDGNISYLQNPTHSYALDGIYKVNLTVKDDDGETNTILRNIIISPNNVPNTPTKPSGSSSGYTGTRYTYSTSAIDIDGDKVRYYFDWGDGTGAWTNFVDSGQVVVKKHEWNEAGTYNVKVKAQDEHGAQSSWSQIKTVTIAIRNNPPNCSLSAITSGDAPLSVTFSINSSDKDGSISSWQLDVDNDGIAEYSGSGNPPSIKKHVYQNAGTYTAKLTVWDDAGASAYDTVIIIVTEALIANFDCIPMPPIKVGEILNFMDNSTARNESIVNYTWNFGDGSHGYGKMVNHTYSEKGKYNVTLIVKDENGNTDSYTMTIKVEGGEMPGFGFAILVAAIAILFFKRRQ